MERGLAGAIKQILALFTASVKLGAVSTSFKVACILSPCKINHGMAAMTYSGFEGFESSFHPPSLVSL